MEWARREIDQLVDYVKASPSQSADRRVMVPGDPERASKKARLSGAFQSTTEPGRRSAKPHARSVSTIAPARRNPVHRHQDKNSSTREEKQMIFRSVKALAVAGAMLASTTQANAATTWEYYLSPASPIR